MAEPDKSEPLMETKPKENLLLTMNADLGATATEADIANGIKEKNRIRSRYVSKLLLVTKL